MIVDSLRCNYINFSNKLNPPQRFCANNILRSDTFVKTQNVSFGFSSNVEKNRQEKVDLFTKNLRTQMYSPSFSISDVSRTISKFVKNINVRPMKQAPKELLFSSTLQGLYCNDLSFDESTNKFFIPKKNRNFYIKTETFHEQFGPLFVFINAVHEFTHILQNEDEKMPQLELYNAYMSDHKSNIDEAVEQVSVAVQTANKIEESVARPFISFINLNQNLVYERVQNGRTDVFDWICRKSKIDNQDAYLKERIETTIQNSEKENNISIDRSLLIDSTILHFEKEIEAYKNENKAHEECLKMQSPLSLTRISVYEKSIEVLKQMKKDLLM